MIGTYRNKVDAYVTLTRFMQSIMVRAGLPEDRIHVKPHFVPDPLPALGSPPGRNNQVVFAGRLNYEKGVDLLLSAWRRLKLSGTRLVIVGDGPERLNLQRRFADLSGVVWRGWLERDDVLRDIARSRYLVMPSRWYETFGMVLIEALSVGTAIIAPNHGGIPEIVTPNLTGLLFSPNNEDDLVKKLSQAVRLDSAVWRQWSANARRAYSTHYTPEVNYLQLMGVYEKAIEHAQKDRRV